MRKKKIVPAEDPEKKKWYFYRFRLNDSRRNPRWWLDLVIIDMIFRNIIKNNGINVKIDFWRFHRRSAVDRAGHQVSLCCYIKNKDRDMISEFIKGQTIFMIFSANNLLKEYFVEEGGDNINGSGDGSWSKEVGMSWPYFIQGLSETILEMIKIIVDDLDIQKDLFNLLYIEELYKAVNRKMVRIWRNEGGHVFLHHLNALFGYGSTITRQTITTSF